MLKQLIIDNFRTWKKTEINFDKGVNVIIGDLQAGKTNIIRSLKLLCTNKPSGLKVINNKTDKQEVDVYAELEEKNKNINKVRIVKSKKDSKYILNDEEFRKIGTKVPEEVKEKVLGGIHFQDQIDLPFLIGESNTSSINKEINKIIGFEKIDGYLGVVNSEKSGLDIKKKNIIKDIKEKKNELRQYNDLGMKQKLLKSIIDHHKSYTDIFHHFSELEILYGVIQSKQTVYNDIKSKHVNCIEYVNKITNNIGKIDSSVELLKLYNRYHELYSYNNNYKVVIYLYDLIEKEIKLLKPIIETYDLIDSIEEDYERLKGLEYKEKEVVEKRNEFLLKNFIDCPYCESKLTPKKTKKLIKGLA